MARHEATGRYEGGVRIEGYRSVRPEDVAPGFVKQGVMSDRMKGGINGAGEAQQSGADPYYDTSELIEKK